MAKRIKRIRRTAPLEPHEIEQLKAVREQVRQECPPAERPKLQPVSSGIGARLREAREARGLTWYALAKLAGISSPSMVRDIEYGRDTKLSNVEAAADALGLRLDVVEIA